MPLTIVYSQSPFLCSLISTGVPVVSYVHKELNTYLSVQHLMLGTCHLCHVRLGLEKLSLSAKSNGYIIVSYTPFHTYKVTIDIQMTMSAFPDGGFLGVSQTNQLSHETTHQPLLYLVVWYRPHMATSLAHMQPPQVILLGPVWLLLQCIAFPSHFTRYFNPPFTTPPNLSPSHPPPHNYMQFIILSVF